MKKTVVLISLVLSLVACGDVDKQKVTVDDKTIEVEKRSFTIACDTKKQLGIAYFKDGYGQSQIAAGGILVGEYYDKFCGEVK